MFRKRAIKAAEQRCFGPVVVAAPPSASRVLSFAAIALCALAAAVTLIEVPDRINAVGVLVPRDDVLIIRAQRSGWVEHVQVSNGDRVTAGAALLRLADAETAPQREPLADELRDSLQAEMTLVDDDLQLELGALARRRKADERRRQALRQQLKSVLAQVPARREETALLRADSERLRALAESGLVSRQNAEAARLDALQAAAAEQELQRIVSAAQLEIEEIEAALSGYDGLERRAAVAADMRRQSLQRQLADHHAQAALQVVAHSDGVVAGLAVRDGTFVRTGQLLMTLYEPGSAMEARLYVSAAVAGRIQRGQEVHLQLDAYPRQIFGSHRAEISEVSAVAVAADELQLPMPLQGPVFEIRAVARGESGLAWHLPPGTVVRAQLIRHRWPLLKWLLRSRSGDPRSA